MIIFLPLPCDECNCGERSLIHTHAWYLAAYFHCMLLLSAAARFAEWSTALCSSPLIAKSCRKLANLLTMLVGVNH